MIAHGRGERVAVPVAVEVRREHGSGAEGQGRDDLQRTELARAAHVRVPGDRAVALRGREDVLVSVAVEIRREDRAGALGRGGDDLLGVERTQPVGVLVPGDLVVEGRGRHHVPIPVAIQVRRGDLLGGEGGVRDHLLGPEGTQGVGVLVPGDFVVEDGGREHVAVAVPVQVGREHGPRSVGLLADELPRSEGPEAVDVLVPGEIGVDVRGGQHVPVPVPVQVFGQHRPGSIGAGRDDALGPEGTQPVGVLVPGEPVVAVGRREDVSISVAVEVFRVDRLRAVGPRRDDPLRAEAPQPIRVLVPGDLVVQLRGGEDVLVSIPVQVGREHRAGPGGGQGDGLLVPEGAEAVEVLVPGDLAVGGGRREHVLVPIPVEVRREHRAGVVGARRDEPRVGERAQTIDVLVPGDLVQGRRRRDQVGVSVPVQVRRVNRFGSEGLTGQRLRRPELGGPGGRCGRAQEEQGQDQGGWSPAAPRRLARGRPRCDLHLNSSFFDSPGRFGQLRQRVYQQRLSWGAAREGPPLGSTDRPSTDPGRLQGDARARATGPSDVGRDRGRDGGASSKTAPRDQAPSPADQPAVSTGSRVRTGARWPGSDGGWAAQGPTHGCSSAGLDPRRLRFRTTRTHWRPGQTGPSATLAP